MPNALLGPVKPARFAGTARKVFSLSEPTGQKSQSKPGPHYLLFTGFVCEAHLLQVPIILLFEAGNCERFLPCRQPPAAGLTRGSTEQS